MLNSSAAPVPAPRTKTFQRMNSSSATGNSPKHRNSPPSSSCTTSPASGRSKGNHPWMAIVHPGPWTQLPRAPPPITPVMQGSWFRPRVPPPNPFRNAVDEDLKDTSGEGTMTKTANQTKPSEATSQSENGSNLPNKSGDTHAPVNSSYTANAATKSKPDDKAKPLDKPIPQKKPAFKGTPPPTMDLPLKDRSAASSGPSSRSKSSGGSINEPKAPDVSGAPSVKQVDLASAGSNLGVPDVAGAARAASGLGVADLSGAASGLGIADLSGVASRLGDADLSGADLSGAVSGLGVGEKSQGDSGALPTSDALPQSCSVPTNLTEASESEQATLSQSKQACKENPFDQKSAIPKSKTYQALPSKQAPGYGFPLIKRKVWTDPCVPAGDLQMEMKEVDKRLETMELRGAELERNLRDCKNDKEQEEMLTDWFSLIQEKHVLVRRDAELVYMTKQQKLDERQADVEYNLRCILNKPESEWSQEDRSQEQPLMDELVAVIEQRNLLISSLDQDRQREKEEDMLLEVMMKSKEFQKEALKNLKKSKGKFKSMKLLRMMSDKAESTKDSKDKKS